MTSKAIIDEQTAEVEFARFVDMMDLDLDTAYMTDEDTEAFEKQKRKIIKAIRNGSLVFNDTGEAVFTPTRSEFKEPLTFHERTGASLMAMDKVKKNNDVAKTYAVLGSMCKVPQKVFAGLVGPDIKLCEALFALLME